MIKIIVYLNTASPFQPIMEAMTENKSRHTACIIVQDEQEEGNHRSSHVKKKSRFETHHGSSSQSSEIQRRRMPARIDRPVHVLNLPSAYRAHHMLKPFKDAEGVLYPIVNVQELVPAANRHLKQCAGGRAFKTYVANDTGERTIPPDGMHLFRKPVEITDSLYRDALYDLHVIFKNPEHIRNRNIHMLNPNTPPTNKILFYSRDSDQPSFNEVIETMRRITPRLTEYTLIYWETIRDMLGTTNDEMEKVSLSLVHYDRMAGLNPHIDTVHIFGNTLGPIFTVAIGDSEKMLDMLPLLLPENHKPTRLFSRPNEIMVMDGASRILWAHAKPWSNPVEQYTLVFKFPELKKKIKTEQFVFEDTRIDIPYYL